MTDSLAQLGQNRMLIAAVLAWMTAQLLKVVLVLILEKRFAADRLFGSGGMPSSHSATVCALAASSAMAYGLASFEFAVTFILAFIVMYDACNVRLETGKQAAAIKELQELFRRMGEHLISPEDTLKELVGHTLPQVIAGAALGTVVGILTVLF